MELTKLDELAPKLGELRHEDLLLMVKSLENLLTKTKEHLSAQEKPSPKKEVPPKPPSSVAQKFMHYHPNPLQDSLVTEVQKHLKTLEYCSNPVNPNSPEILLFGGSRYVYNRQSANLDAIPIQSDPVMAKLLDAVNSKLDGNYNSMLINKYRNVNCYLGPHKDDEPCLDPTAPIATLSLGATRRFQISSNNDKHQVEDTLNLSPRSICCMLPGFQERFYHSVAAGRKSINKAKGVRFSVTFRCVLPPETCEQPPVSTVPDPAPPQIQQPTDARILSEDPTVQHPDTLVFGSSLAKGLDEHLLSKHSRNFKVFTNRGAEVKNIYEDVEKVLEMKEVDPSKVRCIFFICGGNDIENISKAGKDIKFVCEDMEDLIDLTREAFPMAKLNIISLIPRRSMHRSHIDNMHVMNRWLDKFCKKECIRFVDIFSYFLVKKPNIWLLNTKLFNRSNLHFNHIGDSVLAKVLIGVANRPL